jgi:prepilin-type N-terminal cleavage/methylation domain-containing protein
VQNIQRLLNRRNQARRGFTLIELIIVIAIIVILVLVFAMVILPKLQDAKKKATIASMEKLGQSFLQISSTYATKFLSPSTMTKELSSEFKSGVKLDADYTKLSIEDRSKLLALFVAPSGDYWRRAMEPVSGKAPEFKPPLSEDESKGMRKVSGNYEVLIDGWEGVISYEFDMKAAADGSLPPIRLMSPGKDGNWSTVEDNVYWTQKNGAWVGEKP